MNKIAGNLFLFGRDFVTKSLVPGFKVYDEKVMRHGKEEFRIIDIRKSKFGAALKKGLKNIPLKKGMKVLYLGIASGTTASHISDIIGEEGVIYGVEFSPRSIRDLLNVAKKRKNIVPVLADARMPETYAHLIEKVDLIYEDVAQKDQSDILIRNAGIFLNKDGYVMIAIKARSIDVSKKPGQIYAEERQKLEKYFSIMQQLNLEPFEKDHSFILARMR